jgi:hypothetical protein
MIFVKENIAIIASQFDKDTRRAEIIKNCGEQWRKLAAEKREHYIRESEKDRQRFKQDMETYVPLPRSEWREKSDKRKSMPRKKEPNAPKRPLNAYMIFQSEQQPKFAKKFDKQKDVLTAIGALWQKTQDQDRKKYQKRAEMDRERYRKEVETYVKPLTYLPEPKVKKDPLKPKIAMSAYTFYVKDRYPSISSKYEKNYENGKQIMKELGAGWAKMGQKEKKKYEVKAARDRARYFSQMERYKALIEPGESKEAVKQATRKPAQKAPAKKARSPGRNSAKV